MPEHTIMELFKWVLGMFVIFAIVAVGIFCYQLLDVNSYKQQVNYQIERKGGLTEEALSELQKYSEEHFGGRFVVTSDKMNQKVEFGEPVDYEIIATFPIAFGIVPDQEFVFLGTGVSHIR